MIPPYMSVASSASTDRAGAPTTRLRGRWLLGARALWLALALLNLGVFVITGPAYYAHLLTVCAATPCDIEQLTPEGLRAIQALGLTQESYVTIMFALRSISALFWCTIAAVIFWRRSDDWMALCVALFLVLFGAQGPVNALPLFSAVWWVATILADLGWSALSAFCYLFPDGRFVPRWTWIPLVVVLVAQVPESLPPDSPFAWSNLPLLLTVPSLVIVFGIAIFAQIYRYRRVSGPMQRQQTKWVVFGAGLAIGAMILLFVVGGVLGRDSPASTIYNLIVGALFPFVFLPIPLSIGAAVLRSRLYDIDPIINRTLVYSTLTASIVGLYALVVGYLSLLFQTGGSFLISLVATSLVAVLFQPLRDRLQRGINRLLYGERDEPYAVIARLGQRLEGTLAPDAVLPTLVETVAQALKLPYAAVMLQHGDSFVTVAEYPAKETSRQGDEERDSPSLVSLSPPHLVTLSLVYQGETVGKLLLAPRAVGESFSAADQRLLAVLAQQAGVAAHTVRLTTDLQRLATDLQHSRERLIAAREEERRRLRRDLHDGVGPTLASMSQRIDAATYIVRDAPDEAIALLQDLKTQVRVTLADLRRLVYALRPPVLDELGLLPAIREHAAQCVGAERRGETGGAGLRVMVEAPDSLPPLPAAVELAAYRIALEALTNVVRHAQARSCVIRLDVAEGGGRQLLSVEIRDDGRGLPDDRRAGVGIGSMRERAAELGGTCAIEPAPGGGTRVSAQLPL